MERLTKPDSDYCHDRCGSVNGCVRLNGDKKRCRDYDLYERLKLYENVWPAVIQVKIESTLLQGDGAKTLIDDLLSRYPICGKSRATLCKDNFNSDEYICEACKDALVKAVPKVIMKEIIEEVVPNG